MDVPIFVLTKRREGIVYLRQIETQSFEFNHTLHYRNILRKWIKICISLDFLENKAQVGLNGHLSSLITNPDTKPNMKGRFDGGIITGAVPGTQTILIIGHYAFDGNPIIGTIANVNVWSRVLTPQELAEKTRTNRSVPDEGDIVNTNSSWRVSGSLVKRIDVKEGQTVHKDRDKKTLFLSVTKLTKSDAVDLCRKFGQRAYIGTSLRDKKEFDAFYQGLYASRVYVEKCSAVDNGRLRTWLPYRHNSDSTGLVHEITNQPLLEDVDKKFYAPWYSGPSPRRQGNCVGGYFGIFPKYQNIEERDECDMLRCTACELPDSFLDSVTLTLRGLCHLSDFDTSYKRV